MLQKFSKTLSLFCIVLYEDLRQAIGVKFHEPNYRRANFRSSTMHWKIKARIQNAVSLLPSSVSYATYYWIQRHFGSLKRMNPVNRLKAGVETWKKIQELGYTPIEKVFLEVGTGRVPMAPVAYWLMGAKSIITIDLNPYMKEELIRESLEYISDNKEEIQKLFGSLLDK